jgi:dynein heavy chain
MIEEINLQSESTFRLWLTTEPTDKFPVTIVQNSIKATSEPPKGLRANLQKSYKSISDPEFQACTKPIAFRRLLWGLCFFNAIILERRKFGPLGWNIQYAFSASDFKISWLQLIQFLDFYDEVPFEALIYMVAEANYGGRVTDTHDRITIDVILKDYYNEFMIKEENHKLCESGKYFVPADGSRQEYIDFIEEKIPINDITEIFGMHDNAEITSAINQTNDLLDTALMLQPRATSSGGKSQDEIQNDLAVEILNKLPGDFDQEDAARKHPIKYEDSMNTVLQQEILRFQRLLTLVRGSLINIGKAIKGEVVMSPELEQVGNALFDNRTPAVWMGRSYPSLKPLASYVVDFIDRLKFIQGWIDEGAPAQMWISGFFFTQSFLTGLKQNYARKYVIAIDQIDFDFEVVDDETKYDMTTSAPDGAFVWGLYIEGCRWDSEQHVLAESNPKVLFTKMPNIWLKPAKRDEIPDGHRYMTPVYKTLARFGVLSTTGHSTNYVVTMKLNMMQKHQSAWWTKRGVAMITQLSD